uniref:DUF4220 domain-containing protein n=2 Tax=Quercus lobata TaxID=97700 RepID=A0A7N2R136_QUELO
MILVKKRMMIEVYTIPQSWRELWQEWELRGMILLSVTIQIVLVILGNRRKYIAGIWIRFIVWSAYLLGDTIAAMAAGMLSRNIKETYKGGLLDAKYELTAFWAPLMLLHLGGTDAITAYSLEDNELWKRHLFGVATQAMATFYILFMDWTGSRMSYLFIVMFSVGLVKYCERVWVLYSASEKKFRDSIPDITTDEIKIMEECKLKELEGYHKVLEVQVLEVHERDFSTDISSIISSAPHAKELLIACSLLEMVKRLFADLILGVQERDVSRAIFDNNDMNKEKAFEVIEIELKLIFDLLYTKAKAVYTFWGIARRIIGILLTLIVFVVILLDEMVISKKKHHNYSKIDFTITLVLLAVAVLVDLWAIVELPFADQTILWLIKNKKTTLLKAINSILQLGWLKKQSKTYRWSNSIGQISLLRFALQKPLPCLPILKLLCVDEILEIYQNETREGILEANLKGLIFVECRHWLKLRGNEITPEEFHGLRGGRTLKNFGRNDIDWSVKLEMDLSILVWHLATDICCHEDGDTRPAYHKMCTSLSRYMLYLLVKHPYMLPIGSAHIKFRDIYLGLREFMEEQLSKPVKQEETLDMLKNMTAKDLLTVNDGDKSTLVIFYACKLKSALNTNENETWEIIKKVWLEMMCHVASYCSRKYHAQQLRRGGEFVTHVWLLMAHFGLTDQFQTRRNPTIGEVVLR